MWTRSVVDLMDRTLAAIAPSDIIDTFVSMEDRKPKDRAEALWNKLGARTVTVMADSCLCLAQIWESAWEEGGGDNIIRVTAMVDENAIERLY